MPTTIKDYMFGLKKLIPFNYKKFWKKRYDEYGNVYIVKVYSLYIN